MTEAEALVERGRAALQTGDVAAAEQSALSALDHANEDSQALLLLLDCRRRAKPGGPGHESLLRRVVRQCPDMLEPTLELAFLLFARGERQQCETHARNALRLAPRHGRAHAIMGVVFTETNRIAAGEVHLRRAIALDGLKPRAAVHLANCLRVQGKLDDAEQWFRKAITLDPDNIEARLGWCRLEEGRGGLKHGWELLAEAERIAGPTPEIALARAVLYRREKKNTEAIAALGRADSGRQGAMALLERGRLYDAMERHDEAWADFTEGKRLCREVQGLAYDADGANGMVERLKGFFTRSRMELIPRAAIDEASPQPIFILGFPRSGTTMVEQILSTHGEVAAGDELPFIDDLARMAQRWLASPQPYPYCLADLWMADKSFVPDQLRDYYLRSARQRGLWNAGARHFTDKMPLNETHLGLIRILFPRARIVYVRRHPLDAVVSNFANFLTHGYRQAFDVVTSARHYALTDDLLEHYRQELDLDMIELRYENLVSDLEGEVRRLLDVLELGFDPACLSFHQNPRRPRTASYAQVSEKLYARSVGRWRNYRGHLGEAAGILAPVLARLGYGSD